MNVIKKILPVIITVSVLALLVVFRNIPAGQLWEGYTVLYVPSDTNLQTVNGVLEEYGIKEYACLENQKLPIKLKVDSPEYSLLRINASNKENQYLYSRNNYFYDSTKAYKIYYIPNIYKNDLNFSLRAFKADGIKAGIDSSISYPYILPLIVLVLAVILIILSKKKLLFFFLSVLPVVFVASNPFYAAAIAVILLFLCLIVISNICDRKGFMKTLKKHYYIPVLLGIGAACCFSSAVMTGVFYIVLLLAELCILLISRNIKTKKYNKNPDGFHPVFIKSAKKISVYGGKQKILLPLLTVSVLGVFACFALSQSPAAGSNKNAKILLPGTTNDDQCAELPVLKDYCKWTWNVKAAPYKALNKENYNDGYVCYPDFEQNEDGIKQVDKYLYFDDNFCHEAVLAIDDLGYESIENILKKQKSDLNFNFTSSNCYTTSIFSIILMFISLIMLLFIYFSSIIKKGGKK